MAVARLVGDRRFLNVLLPFAAVRPGCSVPAGRQAVMSMEQLRKCRCCLVTNPAGDTCDGLIAGFQQERCMDWPTSLVKRAENTERPSPTRWPMSLRVQGSSGFS